MSIESPVGTLDIKNATLRVGKLEVSNIQGIDTALNVTRSNSILVYDDQASATTFNGFTSSTGVRDTASGYLDVAGGHVYWGQKLPNAWTMEFEMDIRSGTNAGPLYANVFSSTNTGGDGYSFTFNDSNDKITLMYDGVILTETSVPGLFTASENWQKAVINYERGMITVSLGGSRAFYYNDIEREKPYTTGEYVNVSSSSTDGRKIRGFKVTNGDKWTYSGESNITYTHGSLGIGVVDPTATLDVAGTVKATTFVGDGSQLGGISSTLQQITDNGNTTSNTIQFTNEHVGLVATGNIQANYFIGDGTLLSNVVNDTDLQSNVAILRGDLQSNVTILRGDLQSNVTTLRGEMTSNTVTLRGDLQSNVTILRGDLQSNVTILREDLQSNVTILREDLQSNVTALRGEMASNTVTLRGDLQSNVTALRGDLQSNVTALRGEMASNTVTLRGDLQSNVTTLRGEMTSNTVTLRGDLQSNVTILRGDLQSNVTILREDLQSNVTTLRGEMASNTVTLRGDLQSNVTTLRGEMASNTVTLRGDLQSNVTTLRGEMASNTVTLRGDLQSNVTALRGEMASNTVTLRGDLQSNVTILRTGLTSNAGRISSLETDLTSNVGRISSLETDLTSNVGRISSLETDLTSNTGRISSLETDLTSNTGRISSLESADMTISGKKLFSGDVAFESNIHVKGDLLVANTVNMVVSDPIIELGSNNLNTGDLGLVLTRHGATNSNVAIVFDESEDVLNIGYTLSGANDTTIELDSNALAVNVQGALTAASVNGNGSGLTNIQSSNVSDFDSNVTRIGTLETDLTSNVTRIGTLETDLTSNVTRIGTLETDLTSNVTRIGTLETDLTDNATRIGTLETDLTDNVSRIGTLETDLTDNVTRIGTLDTDLTDNVTRIGTLETDLTDNVTRIGTLETDLTDNVTRIGTLETDLTDNVTRIGTLETDLTDNVTRIGTLETDLTDNVTRIGTLETDLTDNVTRIGTLETDLTDNVTRIGTLETDLTDNVTRIGTLETDLTDNVTRIGNLESSDMTIGGEKTFSSNFEVGTANLFVDTTTGNVGIGTTSPGAKLHVDGAIYLNSEDLGLISPDSISDAANRTKTYIGFGHGGTANDWAYLRQIGASNGNHLALDFHDDGGDAGFSIRDVKSTDNPDTVTTRFMVERGGNVGIGTDDPAYKLDVHGTSNVGALTATSVTVPNDGDFVMNNKPLTPATGLHWDTANSRLGVGTASPAYTLHVNGTSQFEAEMRWDLGTHVSHAGYSTNSDWYIRSGEAAGKVILQDTGGNVGIGLTNPSKMLHVKGEVVVGTSADNYQTQLGSLYFIRGAGRNTTGLSDRHHYISTRTDGVAGGGSGNNMIFHIDDSSTTDGTSHVTPLTLRGDGRVGIGTTSPEYTLDVHGTSNVGALTATSVSGDGAGLSNIQTSNVIGLTDNVTRIGTLETDLTSNATRIGTLETDLTSNASRVGTLETDLTSNASRVGTLETDLTSNASRVGTLETDLTSNASRVGTLETDLTDNVTRIGTLETDLTSNVTRIGNLESSTITISGEKTFTSLLKASGGIQTYKDGVVAEFEPATSGEYTLINFHSKVNSGSDKGFILVQDESANSPGTGTEDLRMTIGVHNDFRQSAGHSDELWFQGGGRLCYNVGSWDSELDTIIGTPGVGTTGGHEWRVNNSAKMVINHAGDVGIGTTSPAYNLDIHDSSKALMRLKSNATSGDGDAVLYIDSSQTGESDIDFMHDGALNWRLRTGDAAGTNFQIHDDDDVSRFTIKQDGNVGIGTDSPSAPLHIYKASNYPEVYVDYGTSGQKMSMHTGTAGSVIGYSGYLTIGTITGSQGSGLSQKMRITSDGKVGIGVTSPDNKLEVRGKIQASFNDTNHGMIVDNGGTVRRDYGGGGAGFHFTGNAIWPTDYLGNYSAGGINFGSSTYPWNHVYTEGLNASGDVTTGTNLYVGTNTNNEIPKSIYFGGTYGDNAYDHCVIERRVWSTGTEKQELLLFSGNDGENVSGPDRIRLKAAQILFDTLNNSTDRATENTKMIIRAGGNVGIGTTSPDYKLHVSGDIYATGNITAYSDLRAKSDIKKIENALDKIEKLNGYTFTMKDKRYTGLIAQEVLKVLPEAVTGSEETNYALAYGNMAGLLVEALKDMNTKFQAEKLRNDALEARIAALENA